MNRRKFLQQAGFAVGCVAGGVSGFGCSEDVQGVKAPKSGSDPECLTLDLTFAADAGFARVRRDRRP